MCAFSSLYTLPLAVSFLRSVGCCGRSMRSWLALTVWPDAPGAALAAVRRCALARPDSLQRRGSDAHGPGIRSRREARPPCAVVPVALPGIIRGAVGALGRSWLALTVWPDALGTAPAAVRRCALARPDSLQRRGLGAHGPGIRSRCGYGGMNLDGNSTDVSMLLIFCSLLTSLGL